MTAPPTEPERVLRRRAARRRHGWRPRVSNTLFEGGLIVLSVVLGFAANAWGQRRADRARAAQALAAIRLELQANRVVAAAAETHHRLVHDSLAPYVRAGARPPERIYYYGNMFSPARVLGTAWTSAREGRATDEMPYDLVLHLAQVYSRQDQYRALGDALIASLYADMLRRGGPAVFRDGAANFDLLARDFADRERDLVAEYDSALAHVGRARPR